MLVVDYKIANGLTIPLYGNPINEIDIIDNFVDVLIDKNDIDNYYIDFGINRISGNLESDYYKPLKENNTNEK